jgi:hypothetical protein
VGGRITEDDAELDGMMQVNSLAKLGAALRSATEGTRFFRTLAQWSASYWRWVPMAVALGHLSWVQALAHNDTICAIVEEEKEEGKGPYLAFLYDDMLRRQLEKRFQKKDPDLDADSVFGTVDKQLKNLASQRLESALRHAGLSGYSRQMSEVDRGLAVSSLTQQAKAASALHDQQAQTLRAGGAMAKNVPWIQKGTGPKGGSSSASSWTGGKGKSKDQNESQSKRKQKKSDWWEQKKASWKEKRTRWDR